MIRSNKMIKICIILPLLLIIGQTSMAQSDSTVTSGVGEDSLDFRNELGIALFMGRAQLQYRRYSGDKGMFRFGINIHSGQNTAPRSAYSNSGGGKVGALNNIEILDAEDSLVKARVWGAGSQEYDLRLGYGLEWSASRFDYFAGIDLVGGLRKYHINYWNAGFVPQSSEAISDLEDEAPDIYGEGAMKGNMYEVGLSLTTGIEWYFSERFSFKLYAVPTEVIFSIPGKRKVEADPDDQFEEFSGDSFSIVPGLNQSAGVGVNYIF